MASSYFANSLSKAPSSGVMVAELGALTVTVGLGVANSLGMMLRDLVVRAEPSLSARRC